MYIGDVKLVGIDFIIFMIMFGIDGIILEFVFDKDELWFEWGGVDLIKMDLYDVGKLFKVRIVVDGKGICYDWFLEKVWILN